MPRVEFQPAGVSVEVRAGTLIQDAALLAGIGNLELPCGGQGSCGQCVVELVEGDASPRAVLACQAKVRRDAVIRLGQERDTAIRVVGDSHFLAAEDALPDRGSLSPLYRAAALTVPPASVEEHYSDWARLCRELDLPLHADLEVLRGLAAALRADSGRITAIAAERGGRWCIEEIRPGHGQVAAYGLAIDIGTTTVAAQLVDLSDGRVTASATSYNQQLRRGADIISRIDYARTPERQAELRQLVLDTINGLIADIAGQSGLGSEDIRAAFVAGNTTMIHLLLALPPQYIRESPYVPTVNPVPSLTAREVGLAIEPGAAVEFAPGVGSYVGGDITAGLLSTDVLTNHHDVFLFIDIGTNGEIVVGNADWLVGCACSAGPAFEGTGTKCGMRATAGAIEQITLAGGGREVEYRTVGGREPEGVCGSGLICLLGELFHHGLIDAAGHFNPDPCNPRLTSSGSRPAFLIESGPRTAKGEDLVISEADIANLIRTKAAIYAACSLVLENVGLTWDEIARVYIAGGFGRYIRVSEAIRIGMLPDLPHGRFSYLGNSALTGAYIALLSREHRRRLAETASRMTYLDLSSDPRYMDSYVKAMFLPHTDLSQFPSVTQTRGGIL